MLLKDREPCDHPGCLNHVTHPCEGCGRIMGKEITMAFLLKEVIGDESCPRKEYDSFLTSAAPEMLEILTVIVKQYTDLPQAVMEEVAPEWVSQAISIIRKAKGEVNIMDLQINSIMLDKIKERNENFKGNVGDWVYFLLEKNEKISKALWKELRMNSYERKLLYPLLDDELLIELIEEYYKQSSFKENLMYELPKSYDDALTDEHLPRLIRRFKKLLKEKEEKNFSNISGEQKELMFDIIHLIMKNTTLHYDVDQRFIFQLKDKKQLFIKLKEKMKEFCNNNVDKL